jgi:UDP-3-O-acyl N-acetylglucosamine deacetylase
MDDAQQSMETARQQRTIRRAIEVAGFGYWTGRDVRVEFRPAAEHAGIVFVRGDLPGHPRIPARLEHRVEVPRRTSLRAGAASVDMVEHVLAALGGLAIDNCEVWVDQPEMPGLDGSALPFVEALDAAGAAAQDALRPRHVVRRAIRLGDDAVWIAATPVASNETLVHYDLDYGPNRIGRQSFEIAITPQSFRRELAGCRTFMLKAEADRLLAQGIAARTRASDLLVFDDEGPIDNELRFPDECVRHKVLDVVGDLALAGCDLVGRFSAFRTGHRHNAELVRALECEPSPHQRRRCA